MDDQVSICVPTYNPNISFLIQALESVFDQDYENIEIVLCDNNSDSDMSELKKYLKDKSVSYYRSDETVSMVDNWNKAVSLSSGEYVLVLCDDDMLSKTAISSYVEMFKGNSGVAVCGSARRFIDHHGIKINPKRYCNDRANIFIDEEEYVLEAKEASRLCLQYGNIMGELSCIMFKKEHYDLLNGFDRSYSHAADLDFNLRLLQFGRFAYLNSVFLLRRLHSDNLTNANTVSGSVITERVDIYNNHVDVFSHSKNDICKFRLFVRFSKLRFHIKLLRNRSFSKGLGEMKKSKFFCYNIYNFFELVYCVVFNVNSDRR